MAFRDICACRTAALGARVELGPFFKGPDKIIARQLVLPKKIENWSLTTLQQRLVNGRQAGQARAALLTDAGREPSWPNQKTGLCRKNTKTPLWRIKSWRLVICYPEGGSQNGNPGYQQFHRLSAGRNI